MKSRKYGRPRKRKVVSGPPGALHFSPRGKPGRPGEVLLSFEGYEAVRLADNLGMSQKKAASVMEISQQSFSRIVRKARYLIADAIVNAKTIHIEKIFKSVTRGFFTRKNSSNHIKPTDVKSFSVVVVVVVHPRS